MNADVLIDLPCDNDDEALACPDLSIPREKWCLPCQAYEALTSGGTSCPPH